MSFCQTFPPKMHENQTSLYPCSVPTKRPPPHPKEKKTPKQNKESTFIFLYKSVLWMLIAEVHTISAALHPAQQLVCCHSNCGGAPSSAACLCNGCHSWQRPIRSSHPFVRAGVKMEGWSGWALGIMHLPVTGPAARQSPSLWPGIGRGSFTFQ